MASGRQLAEQNHVAFLSWMASKTDTDFRSMASRGVLSRKEIANECGFAKSALDQNPRIKAALQELEAALRTRGVLPLLNKSHDDAPIGHLVDEAGCSRAAQDAERLRCIEKENAALKHEIAELKRSLEKYAMLNDALCQTGRLPR